MMILFWQPTYTDLTVSSNGLMGFLMRRMVTTLMVLKLLLICPLFTLLALSTLLPSGPYHFVSPFRVRVRRKLRKYFTLCRNLRRTRNEFTNSSALTSNVHEQRRNINKNKMAAAFRTKMAAVSPLSIFSQYK